MSYREFAASECQMLCDNIQKTLDNLNNSDELDADTIGTEVAHGEKMLTLLDAVYHTIRDELPDSVTQEDGLYFAGLIRDIFNGIPLTPLNSYEDEPDEWCEFKHGVMVNNRFPNLMRRPFKTENGEKIVYSDFQRFKFYDLIFNQKMHIEEIGPAVQIENFLDQIIPIQFPYYPKDHVKVYIELFEVMIPGGKEPVKTLAFTHILTNDMEKPARIMKFFTITKDSMEEIDLKVYLTRRQIFAKSSEMIERVTTDTDDCDDSHENNT